MLLEEYDAETRTVIREWYEEWLGLGEYVYIECKMTVCYLKWVTDIHLFDVSERFFSN